MNAIATQRLHQRPNVSTFKSSAFMRGDLMLKLETLYTCRHDLICQQDANILVANSYRHRSITIRCGND